MKFKPLVSELGLKDQVLEMLYYSIFFPRKLPTRIDEPDKDAHLYIMLILESILDLAHKIPLTKDLQKVFEIFKTWARCQNSEFLDEKKLHENLTHLKPEIPFLLHLRGQNASISIRLQPDDSHLITVFQPSASNIEFMSKVSDLCNIYPGSCFKVTNKSLINSFSFSCHLANLSNFSNDLSKAVSLKKGSETEEFRDCYSPGLVYDWLLAFCCSETSEQYVQVVKKYRDHTVSDLKGLPFRRAPMWTTVKAFLNVLLVEHLGENKGKVIFKAVLIYSHLLIARLLNQDDEKRFEIIQKIAKRVNKMEKFKDMFPGIVEKLEDDAFFCISRNREMMEKNFLQVVSKARAEKCVLDANLINGKDRINDFNDLKSNIKAKLVMNQVFDGPSRCSRKFERLLLNSSIPDPGIFKSSGVGSVILQDFESWVRYSLDADRNCYSSSQNQKILGLFVPYFKAASRLYRDDPLGYSRMVLTVFKIILTVDRIATKEIPMLLDHKLGITTELFPFLLLPRRSDVEYAKEMFSYFTKRNKATYPDLLEPVSNSKNLFADRFSSISREHSQLKSKLEKKDESQIEDKHKEVRMRVQEYNSLQSSINSMSCEYREEYFGSYHDRKRCTRCYKTRVANRIKAGVYEKLLPETDREKNLVVFELIIPLNVALLRDAIYLFHKHLLHEKNDGKNLKGIWTGGKLSSYSNKYKMKINLGSTSESFLLTHYSELAIRNNNYEGSYVKPNGYDLYYSRRKKSLNFSRKLSNLKEPFTFKTEENYKGLQWVLSTASYSENQSIAEQGKCPKDLTQKEYLKFSMFRAGINLQLYNLLDAAETRILPFKNNSVYYLICQSLWELGPIHENCEYPEAHDLLRHDKYLDHLYVSISDLLDTCEHNWNEHIVLLNIISICLRVISMTVNLVQKEKFLELLLKARKFNISWQEKIEEMLVKTDNSNDCEKNIYVRKKENFFEEKKNAKGKLLEICCICVLTFFVDRGDFKAVLRNSEDLTDLLMSLTKIYDHKILYGASESPLRKNLMIWMNLAMNEIESYLVQFVNESSRRVLKFLNKKWPDSLKGKINQYHYDKDKYCFKVKYQSNIGTSKELTIGLDGGFLINNQPVSKLPNQICSHELFQRLFHETDFDIMPSDSGSNSLTTKWVTTSETSEILKFSYTFSYLPQNPKHLLIKETRNKSGIPKELELVPHDFFRSLVPKALIENYSHWLSRSKNKIIFRPREFNDSAFFIEKSFTLSLSTSEIKEKVSKRLMISINSRSFKEFYNKIGYRLDKSENMHMYVDSEENEKMTVDFPRYGLSFELSPNKSSVLSKEFRGLAICEDQTLGTLIGLEQGLILIEKSIISELSKKKLIVPHGTLNLSERKFHQAVEIQIEKLRSPSFFIFDIDERIRVLRAGESIAAWLYLAHLHAVTSNLLPDPLLKSTGTSAALQILQSPHTFSCTPLDKESYSTLISISKLSPDRAFVPTHQKLVEKTTWPKHLNSYAAHDGFLFICHKIIEDSNRLGFLHERKELQEQLKLNENGRDLYVKAYKRVRPVEYKLRDEFQKFIGERFENFEELSGFGLGVNWNVEKVKRVKRVAGRNARPALVDWECFFSLKMMIGRRCEEVMIKTVVDWIGISSDFLNHWIELYEICRKCEGNQKLEVLFGLALLAYVGTDMNLVLFLQAVLENQTFFSEIPAPDFESYEELTHNSFDRKLVKKIVESNAITVETYHVLRYNSRNLLTPKEKLEIGQSYLKEIKENKRLIVSHYENQWPSFEAKKISNNLFNTSQIHQNISNLFIKWFKNLQISNFFNKIEQVFNNLPKVQEESISFFSFKKLSSAPFQYFRAELNMTSEDVKLNPELLESAEKLFKSGHFIEENLTETHEISKNPSNPVKIPDFPLNSVSNTNLENFLLQDLQESWKMHHSQKATSSPTQRVSNLQELLSYLSRTYAQNISDLLKTLETCLFQLKKSSSIFRNSLIFPDLCPSEILRQVLNQKSPYLKLNNSLRSLCGAVCVLWTLQQRVERCQGYLSLGESQSLALSRELETVPYENWSPKDFPSWLVLQIELDMMIRPVQVEVAKAMMFPDNNKSLVTQLNMGEGKTSLILPMIALVLADGRSLLRVTVLKSLFNMNKSALMQKLGGVLNKRVYVIPCRRDKKFDIKNIEIIENVLKECLEYRGILISLPEYRLSFILKGLELCRSRKDLELAQKMIEIEKWLKEKGRDILDESDEILSPKYQLIYTIGKQSQVSCGHLRWHVSQAVLDLAKEFFLPLKEKYGDTVVSLETSKDPLAFPHFRLLKKDAYQDLCHLICMSILKGKAKQIKFFELKTFEIEVVSEYILKKEVSPATRAQFYQIIEKNSEKYEIVTILRGIFAYEILLTVLYKRWRVNYGVNTRSRYLLQAVPFRAKDVPADRAQFAHPDIAILLTQLSYLYSGLDNTQLDEVFKKLHQENDPCSEYENWIQNIPAEVKVDESIKTLQGINLSDTHQKYQILYKLLKMHPFVINYWLNTYVYPKEAKEFTGKLGNSAWDLCPDESLTTGFSGTNDSRLLLPLNIEYFGIPELSGTNGSLIESLLLPENNEYYSMMPGISSKEILHKVSNTHKDLRLLLDVGALMLELSNEELVKEWLNQRPDLEAGVFFDENNDLKVVDRKERVVNFEMSPYKNHLQNCVIYLDDSHTRGTDLKIPKGTVGAVTLGKGLTKDRLMQACMRMRMLGKGHRVCFFACYEVDYTIQQMSSKVGAKEVLEWVIGNTRDMIVDQFLYWAAQGLSYYRRLQVYKRYLSKKDLQEYSKLYEENDMTDISSLYAADRVEKLVKDTLTAKISQISTFLRSTLQTSSLFRDFSQKILSKVDEFIGTEKVFSHLFDEEQELELEIEKEEERQKETPKSAVPLVPQVSTDLERYILTGSVPLNSRSFIPIGKGFEESSLKKIAQAQAWSQKIFLTTDFLKTVKITHSGDDYLRPPRWICFNSTLPEAEVVIISAHEADILMNMFKENGTGIGLFMPRTRIDQNIFFSKFNIDIPQKLLQQVAVFAGSMFLGYKEIDEYLGFIGYCPSPRNQVQEKMFDDGIIKHCGFVEKQNRMMVFGHLKCLFQENPHELVMKISEIRNYGIVSKFAHYFEIFHCGRRPF